MILNIAIGLVGLGVVVFIHELGHLLSAKAVGIEVEAFSLGWGRKLAGVSWRGTEYRISVFPLGGYCKMKGEQSYTKAIEQDAKVIDGEPGSFFAARPWRRIVTLFAGPLANLLFAIAILTVVWWIGFTVETFPNRIVLASEFAPDSTATAQTPAAAAADRAGLRTGDTVESINGRVVQTYADLQQIVAQNALKPLEFVVRR
ncbi:MAG: RIP metalloprotease RseP, partial [Spirochaetaceae bacterium]